MLKLPSVRICFVGESFVNATGDPECLGWAGRICVNANKKGYDITYYNLGVRRETSAQLKNRWQREVSERLPTAGLYFLYLCSKTLNNSLLFGLF